jgi:hypothetical protein
MRNAPDLDDYSRGRIGNATKSTAISWNDFHPLEAMMSATPPVVILAWYICLALFRNLGHNDEIHNTTAFLIFEALLGEACSWTGSLASRLSALMAHDAVDDRWYSQ